jgi:hypothetical protein
MYSSSPESSYEDLPRLIFVARTKIVRESRRSNHELRLWVGHANFLDHLTRPSTIARNQQKIFQYGFTTAKRASEPAVEVVEVEGDAPWSKTLKQPRRSPPESPKVSVVTVETMPDDEEEDCELATLSQTFSRHGVVREIPSR